MLRVGPVLGREIPDDLVVPRGTESRHLVDGYTTVVEAPDPVTGESTRGVRGAAVTTVGSDQDRVRCDLNNGQGRCGVSGRYGGPWECEFESAGLLERVWGSEDGMVR